VVQSGGGLTELQRVQTRLSAREGEGRGLTRLTDGPKHGEESKPSTRVAASTAVQHRTRQTP